MFIHYRALIIYTRLPLSPETGGKAGVTGSGWGAERDNV